MTSQHAGGIHRQLLNPWRLCLVALALGPAGRMHGNEPEITGSPAIQITRAIQQHQAVAPVFGFETTVSNAPTQLAQRVGAAVRDRLSQGTSAARPVSSVPRATPNTAATQIAGDSGAEAQQSALARLREIAGPGLEIHLRHENHTLRQLRAPNLLGNLPNSQARVAAIAPSGRERQARRFLQDNADALRLIDPDAELETVSVTEDQLGHTHVKFQQRLGTRRVALAGLSVHFDREGRLNLVDGAYVPTPIGIPDEPAFTAEQAVAKARASVPGGNRGKAGDPVLVIHAPLDGTPRLAWEFGLRIGFSQSWVFTVDALDGSILTRRSRVLDAGVTGAGVDLFNTSRPLNVWRSGNTHYLADTSKQMFNGATDPVTNPRGVITVLDARNKGIDALDDNSVFQVTSGNASAWAVPGAVSAAYNFSQTYDYFLERHGRNSINGSGGNVTAVVNVGNYDNASWHGDLSMMFFGNVKKYPGSLDVVGHELAHGVTEKSANLVYELQPGALNESFSDVFGECVEARTRGANDWKMGSELGKVFRDMRDPNSIVIGGLNKPYPAKFSQFIKLPNSPNGDNGGVHINSSIPNHAFYQLAAGLSGAIGIRDAEKIFYRALTVHLQARSQFLDSRLACVASADALFGAGSTQSRKTAEAFDVTEVFAAPTTPAPPSLPPVNAPDSLMFVYLDGVERFFNLGRREAALNDDPILGNFKFSFDVRPTRPSLTGDGELAIYVDSLKTVCLADTAQNSPEECVTSTRGLVHSIAISPDATRGAYVPLDPNTGEPLGQIVVFGVTDQNFPTKTYNLVSPAIDGTSVDQVLYADSLTFSTDSRQLIYDAKSRIRFESRAAVEAWSIYDLDLETDRTLILVPPVDGINTGNPSLGRAGSRYMAFDAVVKSSEENVVLTMDLQSGEVGEIAATGKVQGYPAFTGDEKAVLYARADNSVSGSSLILHSLAANRLAPAGNPGLFYEDANLGVLYRRGTFVGQNQVPTVRIAASPDTASAPTPVTLTATAQDPDGGVARVEFYEGATKLGEATTTPYQFVWNSPARGEHRVLARAIDLLGAAGDSESLVVKIGGADPGNPIRVAAGITANRTLRLSITGPVGSYFVQQSSDLLAWSDLYPVTIGASGSGSVDDPGPTIPSLARFFRIRK